MDPTVTYAGILSAVLRDESARHHYRQPIRVAAVCDPEAGEFLLVATGWESKRRVESILFHASISNGKIVIEDENLEESLVPALIAAGIPESDITSSLVVERTRRESTVTPAA